MIPGQAAAILAADVGTSSLKAVAFARDGTPTAQVTVDYDTHSPAEGSREQDTSDWWKAFTAAIGTLGIGPGLRAIVLTGTMQNCIAVGPDGQPLGRAILYSDAWVSRQNRETSEERLPADFAVRVGNKPDGAMPIFRIMGGDQRLAGGSDVHYLFGAKDVLIERLTGRAVVDPTTATTTGLFNIEQRGWDAELVRMAGLMLNQLPLVLPADAIVGPLSARVAAELGLPEGLPVINGAGDAGAAAWGAGGREAGQAHVYLGTTGWIASTMTFAEISPPRDFYTLAAPVGEAVIAIAPLLQAGSALDWVRRLGGSPETNCDAVVDRSPPATLFLPYLAGERSPFRDRNVRAAFLGLDERTGSRELHYAALEGLCHAIRDNLEAIELKLQVMPLIGGVAENPILRQLLADTLGIPVMVAPHARLATAYGAFQFAAATLGWQVPRPHTETRTVPRSERRDRTELRFRAYRNAQRMARDIAADLLVAPDDVPRRNTTGGTHVKTSLATLALLGGLALGAQTAVAAQVAVLTPYLASVTTSEMVKVFRTEAEARHHTVNVVDTRGDMGALANRIDDVVNGHVGAIVLVSVNPGQVQDQVNAAAKAGIPVISIDGGVAPGVTLNVTSDNYQLGLQLTKFLFDRIGNKGNIVKFFYSAHPGVHQRELALDAMLKEHPDVKVIADHYVKVPGPIDDARTAMQAILQRDGTRIDAVWAAWDEPAIGADLAVGSDMPDAKLVIGGIDGTAQGIDLIKQCTPMIVTVAQDFGAMSRLGMEGLDKVLAGGKPEKQEIYAPAHLVTRETLGAQCAK